ncbi:hypothetical protein BpHYR1_009728 [Brachionus plicatilis]|uniref:Uncharacterized protein n=1 Tax=Brachionus plicatilis TaxID=10195 RepID=A0A3M7R4Q9_BRAPC|nr:hypothetical protein BpHYR1_009728 [Brachionus plicatilis]
MTLRKLSETYDLILVILKEALFKLFELIHQFVIYNGTVKLRAIDMEQIEDNNKVCNEERRSKKYELHLIT